MDVLTLFDRIFLLPFSSSPLLLFPLPTSHCMCHLDHTPGDFLERCPHRMSEGKIKDGMFPPNLEKCASTSLFGQGIDRVLNAIEISTNVPLSSDSYPFVISKRPKHVFVATNAEDPAFLADIEARGWKMLPPAMVQRLRDEGTDWTPTLMDKVILSLGRGFVGSWESTSE